MDLKKEQTCYVFYDMLLHTNITALLASVFKV